MLAAALVTRLLTSQLFDINRIDPATSVSTMILLAAGILASVLPGHRAMRVDPVEARRAD